MNLFCLIFLPLLIVGYDVDLYEDPLFKGRHHRITRESCETIPPLLQGKLSSIATRGTCVFIYQNDSCTGDWAAIAPGTYGHSNLQDILFNDKVQSIGPCNISASIAQVTCPIVPDSSNASCEAEPERLIRRLSILAIYILFSVANLCILCINCRGKYREMPLCLIFFPLLTSAYNVRLFEDPFFNGKYHRVVSDSCEEVPEELRGKLSSIHTHGTCVVVYQDDACAGDWAAIAPGTYGHSHLNDIMFDNRVKSIGPCTLTASSTESLPDVANSSAEFAGHRTLKSFYGTYLRNRQSELDSIEVDMAPHRKECEQWTVEEHEGKVALKAYCSDKYLRANPDYIVDLAESGTMGTLWLPSKNQDGSWSLKSAHGTWLRAQPHGRVSLQDHVGSDESFWLESWALPIDVTSTTSPSITTTDVTQLNVTIVNSAAAESSITAEESVGSINALLSTLNELKISPTHLFETRDESRHVTKRALPMNSASDSLMTLLFAVILLLLIIILAAFYEIIKLRRSVVYSKMMGQYV